MKLFFRSNPFRLSVMMLLQHMMFAVWWVPFAAYLINIHITGFQNALILSSMAIGCLASPLFGMIADRYFPGQKVLAALNLANGILMLLAGLTTHPDLLFLILLLSMLCYMPTWSLTSSIAMTHAPSDQFPRIRVFGSIGCVASGVFSLVTVNVFKTGFDGTNIPFFCAGAISLTAFLFNLSLPPTPPLLKGKKGSLIDAFGLRTIKLMSDRNFAVFIILSFLSVIPFSMYWSYYSEFLQNSGFKYITITMNWGQVAEMLILVSVSYSIRKVGLRKTMIIGLFFLFIRYLAFFSGIRFNFEPTYFIGILVHGFIFGYFFVGGQIYIDKKAPPELKSQAQGFIFLVTFGLGLLTGNFISRQIIDNFTVVSGSSSSYNWEAIWGITALMSLAILIAFALFFRNESEMKKAEA